MLHLQILAVLLSLIPIFFLLGITSSIFLTTHCLGYGDPTFNSKNMSSDHSPSTCGVTDINLKCPFQFSGADPDLCAEGRVFEFSCEDNRTVLSLSTETHSSVGSYREIQQYNFYVELNSIDYEQQTLRIFDPGVQKNDCSTLPVNPCSPYLDYYHQPGAGYGMYIDPDAVWLVFVSCKNPVKSKNPPLYVDTASCNISANHFSKMKAPSNYYSYVVLGESVVASDIEESFTVYKMAPVDLRRLPNVTAGDMSFQDIHKLV